MTTQTSKEELFLPSAVQVRVQSLLERSRRRGRRTLCMTSSSPFSFLPFLLLLPPICPSFTPSSSYSCLAASSPFHLRRPPALQPRNQRGEVSLPLNLPSPFLGPSFPPTYSPSSRSDQALPRSPSPIPHPSRTQPYVLSSRGGSNGEGIRSRSACLLEGNERGRLLVLAVWEGIRW